MPFLADAATRAELTAAASKSAWAAVIVAALGPTRRVRLFRDANAAATDVFATGVEFRNVGSSGTIKVEAGQIKSLGRLKGTTVSLAADITTGASIVRVEGNGRWIQGSLGPTSAYDFISSSYFTATNGLGLTPNFTLSGPLFLATGTGPAAPELDADAPAHLRILDYANEASPVTVGTVAINVRDPDFVLDNAQLASEIGDVRMMRVADGAGIVFGTGGDSFRFAATVMAINKALNATDANKPVYQVKVNAVPHGRWPSFPYRKDFNIAVDTLSPKPFKAQLLRADMTVLHTFEMYSTQTTPGTNGTGKPINYVGQTENKDVGPVQPWWTCQMSLFWESAKRKRNTKAFHYMPGVDAVTLHGSNVTAFDSAPEQWPIITGNYLQNGLGKWRMSPKWSRKLGTGLDTTIIDPFVIPSQVSRDNYVNQLIGYGYEPGSTGHHIWYMSPGGSRHDRAPWPHVLVAWASDPAALRPHGNVPLETLKDEWMKTYFNEGSTYHTNLERGITIQKSKLLIGNVAYNDTYYNGGNENFTSDIQNSAIRLLTMPNQDHSAGMRDKNGRRFTNEFQRDNQHSHSNAAVGLYLDNSPMHALQTKVSFDSHIAAGFDMSQGNFDFISFLTRQHAWHMWQHANMWMATSSDARTISRSELETMWERHLVTVYDTVYARATNPGPTDTGGQMLKTLGMVGKQSNFFNTATGKDSAYIFFETDSKQFYMGQVLLLMKQSGSWAAMRARNAKCAAILDLIVVSCAKASVDFFVDSKGRVEAYERAHSLVKPLDNLTYPATWGEYVPAQGQEDWIRNVDGTFKGGNVYIDAYNTQHFRAQFVYILRDFFAEFNFPRVTEAVAVVDEFYNTVESRRVAGTGEQWHWKFAMMGKFTKPAVIGAPV